MSAIRRLSPDVASRIAAGEVVERPASVLKELLENSLDASAAKVSIESSGAGRRSLRVADDGAGMDPEDCRLAFERHATSKIAALEDIERLSTFGFRGEALFSVAAVARVSLASCPKGAGKGWLVEIADGRLVGEHEAPAVAGTTVEVRELFHNTPARAKFLKSDAVERSRLARVVEEAALANPAVAVSHKSEGRQALRFAAEAGPDPVEAHRRRVAAVLGGELARGLLTCAESRGALAVRAFLAPPEDLSPSRNLQFYFINRRPVASRLLSQALYRAYEPFLSRGRHPVAAVFLELPPDRFDVNVHPAKREVRFQDDRVVFEVLAGALSGTLLKARGIPTLAVVREPRAAYAASARMSAPPAEQAALPELLPPPDARARWYTPPFAFLGQVERSYLVFDAAGGLLVVDQHAAQERILYERCLAQLDAGKVPAQPLMLPLIVELPASRVQEVLARAGALARIGFEVEAFGKTGLRVVSAPALFQEAVDLKELVHRLLESLDTEKDAAQTSHRRAAAMIACKAAVKAHDRLGGREALALLEELKDCANPGSCPHGRPSMLALGRDELARRFKRPGAPPV